VLALRDGLPDEPVLEARAGLPDLHPADAFLPETRAWDAWGGALRDEAADAALLAQAAARAEKLAALEPAVRALAGKRPLPGPTQALCTPDEVRSAA